MAQLARIGVKPAGFAEVGVGDSVTDDGVRVSDGAGVSVAVGPEPAGGGPSGRFEAATRADRGVRDGVVMAGAGARGEVVTVEVDGRGWAAAIEARFVVGLAVGGPSLAGPWVGVSWRGLGRSGGRSRTVNLAVGPAPEFGSSSGSRSALHLASMSTRPESVLSGMCSVARTTPTVLDRDAAITFWPRQ
ncbi:hypothetical protein FHR83_008777 [Actinoplanes campanulatus]|uniref:Uncharacterized protein n=1 Tax=Actinoplanes campanulatus TaxID=113559 RepID=A0A7W5FJS3_9ACTN|nr:hypothetical protein [Actinoplanes campanulatus]MBB3101049.1 hypothetical protein [Actinoplanes campanulatus]